MELSAELDTKNNIVIIHVNGIYRRPEDGFAAQDFVIKTYPEYKCRRILLDLTQAEIVAGTMPTFKTANPAPDVATELRKFQFAAVYPTITEDDRFFETVAVNRGLTVRAFDRLEEAVKWLKKF